MRPGSGIENGVTKAMRRIRTTPALVAMLAAVVVAAGAGAAIAAGSGSAPAARSHVGARHGLLAVAASYIGVAPKQLRQEVRAGSTLAQIAAAHGKSEAGLIQALEQPVRAREKARLAQRITALVQGRARFRPGDRPRVVLALRSAAIAYLGVPAAQLRSDLGSGRTLAQIAASLPGKSEAGLIAAIVEAARKRIAAALAAGRITSARAARIEGALPARIKARVNAIR